MAAVVQAVVVTSFPVNVSAMQPYVPDACMADPASASASASAAGTSAAFEVGVDCNILVLPTHSSAIKGAIIKAFAMNGNLSAEVGDIGGGADEVHARVRGKGGSGCRVLSGYISIF